MMDQDASMCACLSDTSNNQGALYYNTTSNAVRGCVGGNWEDVVTTSGLGLITYGVVPDSGSGGGDLTSVANLGVSGPCKVSFVTTTTVKIAQGCTAYSGGRKIIIPDNTTPTGILNFANNSFTHVCLNGVNNQPAFSASGTEAANLPTFSVNNPVLCLADIRTTPNVLASIYDVRTFTTTDKSFGTLNATTGFLGASIAQGAAGLVSLSSVASQTGLRGVVVATQGSVAVSNTPNMIVALRGPQFVKSLATSTVGGFLQTTTTAGYTSTAAISNTGYSVIGTAQRTIDTLCTLASNCQFSQLVDINIR